MMMMVPRSKAPELVARYEGGRDFGKRVVVVKFSRF